MYVGRKMWTGALSAPTGNASKASGDLKKGFGAITNGNSSTPLGAVPWRRAWPNSTLRPICTRNILSQFLEILVFIKRMFAQKVSQRRQASFFQSHCPAKK